MLSPLFSTCSRIGISNKVHVLRADVVSWSVIAESRVNEVLAVVP